MSKPQKAQQEAHEISQEVVEILYGIKAFELYKDFSQKLSIDSEKIVNLTGVIRKSLEVGFEILPGLLELRLGLDKQQSEKLSYQIAIKVLFPVRDEIDGFVEAVKQWGGDASTMEKLEKQITPQEFVQMIISETIPKGGDHLQDRAKHVLLDYVSEKNDRAKTIEFIVRDPKVGGLGLEEAEAKNLLDFVDKKKVGFIIEEDKPVEPKVVEVPVKKRRLSREERLIRDPIVEEKPKIVSENVKPKELEAFTEKDAFEVDKINGEKQHIITAPNKSPKTIQEMVDEVCKKPSLKFNDKVMMDRCKKVVETRIRNVRTAEQTRKHIEQPIKQGGLGVSGRALSEMLEAIEQYVSNYEQTLSSRSEVEKAEHIAQKLSTLDKKQVLDKKQQQVLSKRYASITGQVPLEHVEPVSPSGARVSAGISHEESVRQQENRIDKDRVRNAIEKANKQKAVNSVKPILAKPQVQDIKSKKRLSGPIEELRYMTLSDFRRLSKNPNQAITKVMDIVELVHDQGYHKKVEAIKAWKASPINQIYIALTQKSILESVPLEELRLSQEASKTEMLTKEELDSIIKLNTELRF